MLFISYEGTKKKIENSKNIFVKLAKKALLNEIETMPVFNRDSFITKGHWINIYDTEKKHHKYQCNRCGKCSAAKAPYCLKCGAKMIDEEDI